MIGQHRLIIAIGSNTDHEENMIKAKKLLSSLLTISYTSEMWTTPEGINSDKFLNCLGLAETKHGIKQLERAFKQIERRCGDAKSKRNRGTIVMDIDILQYDQEKLHKQDWSRDYIQKLMKEIEFFKQKTD